MSASVLMRDLMARGVEVLAEGEHLRIRAPKGLMTRELRERITECKPVILRLLTTDWALEAGRLLSQVTDPAIRRELQYLYEETAAKLEFDQGLPRVEAEMCALGQLQWDVERLAMPSVPKQNGWPYD